MAAEMLRLLDRQLGIFLHRLQDLARNVLFRMSRGEQDERYDNDSPRPAFDEPPETFRNRWLGKLQESEFHQRRTFSARDYFGQLARLGQTSLVARTMPHEQPASLLTIAYCNWHG